MRDPWKALPWVASISLHATAFFFLAGLLLKVPPPLMRETRIDLALSFTAGGQPGETPPARRPKGASAALHAARSTRPQVRPPPLRGVSQGERPRSPSIRDAVPEPGVQDGSAAQWEETWSTDGAEAGMRVVLEGSGAQIRWDTVSRKLIRKRDPMFPAVLSALGQEVECEARITVAPSGGVTRVEITRSSGYTEIDAGVEAALRDYLFSRADGSTETVGTKWFRFRLEKTD